MNPIRLISLYSGSGGNAFLILTPVGNLLIDAGKNAKKLCLALESVGVSPDSIGAILITHEHAD
ncbi:MAG: MBL fold metallo-hydrolase, partial [Clostridia bacterium]|nr:MBL fold metallo-hydrolase [Clostridia bacterium]